MTLLVVPEWHTLANPRVPFTHDKLLFFLGATNQRLKIDTNLITPFLL
jgi:hypothetical protein